MKLSKAFLFKHDQRGECCYYGRNGSGREIGLCLDEVKQDCLAISPINSKKNIGSCQIEIPLADLPMLMATLAEFLPNRTIVVKEKKQK